MREKLHTLIRDVIHPLVVSRITSILSKAADAQWHAVVEAPLRGVMTRWINRPQKIDQRLLAMIPPATDLSWAKKLEEIVPLREPEPKQRELNPSEIVHANTIREKLNSMIKDLKLTDSVSLSASSLKGTPSADGQTYLYKRANSDDFHVSAGEVSRAPGELVVVWPCRLTNILQNLFQHRRVVAFTKHRSWYAGPSRDAVDIGWLLVSRKFFEAMLSSQIHSSIHSAAVLLLGWCSRVCTDCRVSQRGRLVGEESVNFLAEQLWRPVD